MKASAVLTRPQGKNETLVQRLAQAGLDALALPALLIKPVALRAQELPLPELYDLIVFVSGNAARFYIDTLDMAVDQNRPCSWPSATWVATVGAPSAQLLESTGRIPPARILYPTDTQDSEGLWRVLQPLLATFKRVLIVRGQSGREWLGDRFQQAGIHVDRLALYDRQAAVWDAQQSDRLAAALAAPAPCVFLLTSAEGVDAVHANMLRLGLQDAWARARFVVIHERVASRLQSLLQASGKVRPPMVKLCQPSEDAIFQTIVRTASF